LLSPFFELQIDQNGSSGHCRKEGVSKGGRVGAERKPGEKMYNKELQGRKKKREKKHLGTIH
jgi:hypothetical protein